MVARILSGNSIRGLLNYNESKASIGKAILILANRFGLDIEQLELRDKQTRFEHLTKLNSRVKTNALHVMLNFDGSDKLDTGRLQAIALDYMGRIGFGEQPFLVYRHKDANHPHLHIVTTNIRSDGSRIDLHNIGRDLSEKARKEIEQQYNLTMAEGRGMDQKVVPADLKKASYGKVPTKESIYNVVTAVVRDYKFTSLAEYNAVLHEFNVIADRGLPGSDMYEKRGLIYSLIDKNGNRIGIPFKASSLAGRPILKNVEGKFAKNLLKRKAYVDPVRNTIDAVMNGSAGLDINKLINALHTQRISLLLRRNDRGHIYGTTFIDHNTRSVFNGSDLGKAYGAKRLLETLEQTVTPKVVRGLQDREGQNFVPSESPPGNFHTPKLEVLALSEILIREPELEQIGPINGNRKKRKKKKKSKNTQLGK